MEESRALPLLRRTNPMKALLLAVTLLLAAPTAFGNVEETRTTLRAHVLRLINADRQLYGLPPVELDDHASIIGDAFCRQQIQHGTNGHFTIDGLTPYMRYSFAGGNDGISENAAAWSATYAFSERALYEMARRSQDAMMAEAPPNDGHKKTILDPHATHVGVGLAWHRGEFRLVHEFIRRYIDWTQPIVRRARIGEKVTIAGRPLNGAVIDAISVHLEPVPNPMSVAAANAIANYTLPAKRTDYLPRLSATTTATKGAMEVVRREYADGRRGEVRVARDGAFTFDVPFPDGPGIYTVVVWVRRGGTSVPIAASNISIRVDDLTPPDIRATGAR